MGCCQSVEQFVVNENIDGQGVEVVEVADKLMLYKYQVDKLWHAFTEVDCDNSGFVNTNEFCGFYRLECTPFTRLILKMLDQSGREGFTFLEFFMFCNNFLTMESADLARFSFEIFDFNCNGVLERSEVRALVKVIWGKKKYASSAYLQSTLEKLECNIEGDITLASFISFTKSYSIVIKPAFEIQQVLRAAICGSNFWEKMTKQRIDDHGAQFVHEILGLDHHRAKQLENLASIETLPQSIISALNNAKNEALKNQSKVKKAVVHKQGDREKHAEEMRKRKVAQTSKETTGVIRRLTLTASDVLGNKYQRLLAKKHEPKQFQSAHGEAATNKRIDEARDKKEKEKKYGVARRITNIVLNAVKKKGGTRKQKYAAETINEAPDDDDDDDWGDDDGNMGEFKPSDIVKKKPGTKVSQNTRKQHKDRNDAPPKVGRVRRITNMVIGGITGKSKKDKYAASVGGDSAKHTNGSKKPGIARRLSNMIGIGGKGKVIPMDNFKNIGDEEPE